MTDKEFSIMVQMIILTFFNPLAWVSFWMIVGMIHALKDECRAGEVKSREDVQPKKIESSCCADYSGWFGW